MKPTSLRKHFAPSIRRRRPATLDTLPPVKRLAIVCCYFNPMHCPIVKQNALRFLAETPGHVFPIQLSFDGKFDLCAPGIHGDERTQLLWQKERLLNIAEQFVPREFDAIAWIDMDVTLNNTDWIDHTLHTLSINHVCQLFSHAEELHDETTTPIRPSVCYGFTQNDPQCFHLGHYHPGFAWAMRRDTWRKIDGLLETNVVGNGDTHMCRGFFNAELWTDRFMSPAWKADTDRWKHKTARVIEHRIGCVPGLLTHHWHGNRADRKYVDRLSYLGDHDFTPHSDIEVDPNNQLLRWTDYALEHKPEMIAKVKGYFHERTILIQP